MNGIPTPDRALWMYPISGQPQQEASLFSHPAIHQDARPSCEGAQAAWIIPTLLILTIAAGEINELPHIWADGLVYLPRFCPFEVKAAVLIHPDLLPIPPFLRFVPLSAESCAKAAKPHPHTGQGRQRMGFRRIRCGHLFLANPTA